MGLSVRENLRIIWAITSKDVISAVKDRHTLGVILSTLALVVFYRLIPQFTAVSGLDSPTVLIYDAGNSALVEALEESVTLEAYEYESSAAMKEDLAFGGDKFELGLVIPANFDQIFRSGGQAKLDGFVLHWVTESEAKEIQELVEHEMERWAGKQIQVQL